VRILWLTVDRSARVADIFGPLQRATAQIADVRFVVRRQWRAGRYDRSLPPIVTDWDADVVFTDAPFAFPNEAWPKGLPKACLIEDQHGPNVRGYVADCLEAGFGLFLSRYPGIERFHPDLPRVEWLPHCIDPAVFHPDGAGKRYETLMTGRVHPGVYPVRQRIHDALNGKPHYTRIPRPPEGSVDPQPTGAAYAAHLQAARIAFACTSCHHYPVLKLFEIAACGAVLVCDWIDTMAGLRFRHNIRRNMLELRPDEPVADQVEAFLARPDLDQIAAAGAALIAERHTADVRARELLDCLGGLM
jgi:hypothetical protein